MFGFDVVFCLFVCSVLLLCRVCLHVKLCFFVVVFFASESAVV